MSLAAPTFFIDSDGGIDDALAIALGVAIGFSRLRGVTAVFGNVPVFQAAQNIQLVLELMRARVPVFAGAAAPLKRPPQFRTSVHGEDGLGNVRSRLPMRLRQPAGSSAVDSAAAAYAAWMHQGDDRTIVCMGPLTNLARLVGSQELNLERISLYIMGGNVKAGNVTPYSEYNFYADPHAANMVLASGINIRLFPLDVCRSVVLTRSRLRRICNKMPMADLANFLWDSHQQYMNYCLHRFGIDGCYPHDSLPLIAIFMPELFKFRPAKVRVEEMWEERLGACSIEFVSSGSIEICDHVDVEGLLDFLERVLGEYSVEE